MIQPMPMDLPESYRTTLLDAARLGAMFKPRSQRFPIHAQLRYRESGEAAWHETSTVNISRTGVLFQTTRPLQPDTILEMEIVFPPALTGGTPANISCFGPVVRTAPSVAAAAIRHYRLRCQSAD